MSQGLCFQSILTTIRQWVHLKNAIWEMNRVILVNVDAPQVTLWKVGGFSPLSLIYAHEILSGTCSRREWN